MAKWLLYPLTFLLDHVFAIIKSRVETLKTPEALRNSHIFYYIELAAALERVIAYGHSGFAKVLETGLLRPLWLLLGIMRTGYPSLNPKIVSCIIGEVKGIVIHRAAWPMTQEPSPGPAMTSLTMQRFRFGEHEATVSPPAIIIPTSARNARIAGLRSAH